MTRPVWCHWHSQVEEVVLEPYRICGECSHVYNTAEEMLEEWNSDRPEGMRPQMDPELVYCCPYCLHDW